MRLFLILSLLSFGLPFRLSSQVIFEIENPQGEPVSLLATSSVLEEEKWFFIDGDTKHFVVPDLPDGDYCFSFSPTTYESYKTEYILSIKASIRKDSSETFKAKIPNGILKYSIDSDLFVEAIKEINFIEGNFTIIGELKRKCECNMVQRWIFIDADDLSNESIAGSLAYASVGEYEISYYLLSKHIYKNKGIKRLLIASDMWDVREGEAGFLYNYHLTSQP